MVRGMVGKDWSAATSGEGVAMAKKAKAKYKLLCFIDQQGPEPEDIPSRIIYEAARVILRSCKRPLGENWKGSEPKRGT